MPVSSRPSSGIAFHSLHATSHALQPMHTDVSVKKPMRGGASAYPAARATSGCGPESRLRPGPAAAVSMSSVMSGPPRSCAVGLVGFARRRAYEVDLPPLLRGDGQLDPLSEVPAAQRVADAVLVEPAPRLGAGGQRAGLAAYEEAVRLGCGQQRARLLVPAVGVAAHFVGRPSVQKASAVGRLKPQARALR